MEKYRKFIEKAYNGEIGLTMCQDWKAKIEEEFPETFKPYKIGDWVWVKSPYFLYGERMLVYFNGFSSCAYGFYAFGFCFTIWTENFRFPACHKGMVITKATNKEVKDALIAEANKRGFKKGVTIIPVGYDNPQKISDPFYCINNHRVTTTSPQSEWDKNCSNPPIYRNGVWASIVAQQTELTLEQIAEKFNINVGDLRIKGVSSEANRPFKVGDIVEIIGDDTYHNIPIGTICRISKSSQRRCGSWCIDYISCGRCVYERDMKHAN